MMTWMLCPHGKIWDTEQAIHDSAGGSGSAILAGTSAGREPPGERVLQGPKAPITGSTLILVPRAATVRAICSGRTRRLCRQQCPPLCLSLSPPAQASWAPARALPAAPMLEGARVHPPRRRHPRRRPSPVLLPPLAVVPCRTFTPWMGLCIVGHDGLEA